MSAYVFYIKQGDRRPKLEARLKNADNSALDLSGASLVVFHMRDKDGNVVIDGGGCTVSPDSDGVSSVVQYEWDTGDTDTVGTYKGEFEITWASGITQTLPEDDYVKIVVKDDLS